MTDFSKSVKQLFDIDNRHGATSRLYDFYCRKLLLINIYHSGGWRLVLA